LFSLFVYFRFAFLRLFFDDVVASDASVLLVDFADFLLLMKKAQKMMMKMTKMKITKMKTPKKKLKFNLLA